MTTHFFSTSAGFWEKVAIVVTLSWIPVPEGDGAFLVAWLGCSKDRPKKKTAPKGCISGAAYSGNRLAGQYEPFWRPEK
jgi:hypothetical protein